MKLGKCSILAVHLVSCMLLIGLNLIGSASAKGLKTFNDVHLLKPFISIGRPIINSIGKAATLAEHLSQGNGIKVPNDVEDVISRVISRNNLLNEIGHSKGRRGERLRRIQEQSLKEIKLRFTDMHARREEKAHRKGIQSIVSC